MSEPAVVAVKRAPRRPARPNTRSRANPGRVAAARALLAVDDEGRNVEEALAEFVPGDPADRALAWNLALGVLRHRAALDEAITTAARRAVWTLDPPVLSALRAGLYELAFTRTPPHAAVDQGVELARALGAAHAAGFVNAILRRGVVPLEGDVSLGFPAWMIARWRSRLGSPRADSYMRACAEPAAVHLVVKEDPAGVAASFQKAGIVLVPAGEGVFRLPARSGRVDELPGFAEGRWWIMDPAAVAVADLVPNVAEVLDVCAAPGGKSLRLAARGMRVTATDLDAERLARIAENAARVGLSVPSNVHDWSAAPMAGAWPAVLVDAPCTALGLVRRHPEIRWRRTEADVAIAAARQAKILSNAASCVAPGGALIYAVCSPEPEEGPMIAAKLGWPVEATYSNEGNPEGADVFWGCRMRRPA
ncbi:MFS transporter [Deltaproteobacteria bacterium]|nr:MFS transporter [Deltaproteobacteria bacterium]